MPKRSSKRDTRQSVRHFLDQVASTAKAAKQPAPNKAKPPRPAKKQDVADIEQADTEGMAQPQGLPPPPKPGKKTAAVAPGRSGGMKGAKARAAKLTPAKRKGRR